MSNWDDPGRRQPQYSQRDYPPPQPPQYLPAPYQQPWPYQPQYPQVAPKSPALAVIVSAFIPGAGSMMCGHAGRGIWLLALWLVSCVLCLVVIGFLLAPAFWIGGMVMAHSDAVAWNREHGIVS